MPLQKVIFDSIGTRTLREHIYKAIKNSILMNKLLPGQEVSIGELAVKLGVSETPVREALAMLKTEGLIDCEPHKKLQIAKITEENVRQVYEVRKLLEPHAVSLVIASISKNPQLKENLRIVHEQARKIISTAINAYRYEDYIEIDMKLNEIFLQGPGNTLFGELLAFVGDRSMRIRTFVEATCQVKPMNVIHTITEEHQTIIQAMLDGNIAEAQMGLHRHLLNGESRTLEEIFKYKKDSSTLDYAFNVS